MIATPAINAGVSSPFARARSANATDSSFPAFAPTATQPSGAGVLAPPGAGWAPVRLIVVPFGAGADDSTFDIKVVGWRECAGLWVPCTLFEATATLSAAVGVAGTGVLAAERFADTVSDPVAGKGTKGADCLILTPADDTPAQVILDARGSQFIQILFDLGTATGANALVAWV